MRIAQTQQIGTFRAMDARGACCKIVVLQQFVQSPAAGRPHEWLARRKLLQLENGNPVDQLADGTLFVSRTGARLHRLS